MAEHSRFFLFTKEFNVGIQWIIFYTFIHECKPFLPFDLPGSMASSSCVGSWEMLSWVLKVKRIWGTTSQSLQLYLILGCPLDIWEIKSSCKSLALRFDVEIHFWKSKTYGWYLKITCKENRMKFRTEVSIIGLFNIWGFQQRRKS